MVTGRFEGKVALVTGAAGEIGAATAALFAAEGARVIVADRDETGLARVTEEIAKQGGQCVAATCDQTDPDQVEALFTEVTGKRLDVCFANAGYARFGPVLGMDLATWQRHVDVNLTGTFLVIQGAARLMAAGEGGSIVINASTAALRSCTLFAAYAASKAGVEMLARSLADELGPLGIRVNTVCPGVIDTGMTRRLLSTEGEAIRRLVESETPVGRVGCPDDVARAVAFLAHQDAAFVTGASLLVDGGETLRGFPRWFTHHSAEQPDPAWRLVTSPASGRTVVAPLR